MPGININFSTQLLNHALNYSVYTSSIPYVALFDNTATQEGLDDTSIVGELSGNGYNRVFYNPWVSNGLARNNSILTFPTATADWNDVYFMAVMDSPTPGAGNVLFSGGLLVPVTVLNGQAYTIPTSKLVTILGG